MKIGAKIGFNMLTIKNAKATDGSIGDFIISSSEDFVLDAGKQFTLMPALVAPHLSIENTKPESIIAGGFTTIFETATNPASKKKTIEAQLALPLHLYFFLEVGEQLDGLGKFRDQIIGVKFYMCPQTKNLCDKEHLERLFQVAALENYIVTLFSDFPDRKTTTDTIQQAISLTEKYSCQLCILNVRTTEVLSQIRDAKSNALLVYAETTPKSLFLNGEDSLMTKKDQDALWQGIHDETLDMIGPDQGDQQTKLMLPLLLNAYHEKKISLEQIIILTRMNPELIFDLPHNDDFVLVDLEKSKDADKMTLKGWPIYTILNGQAHRL